MIMGRMKYYFLLLIVVAVSCGTGNDDTFNKQNISYITEQADGSIVLNLKEAYLLHDSLHPDMNTAEWSISIKNKGRYELWLSSFTKDTMDLKYDSPVIINFGDKRIQGNPIGNEIVLDTPGTGDVYFRADSKLGSVYVDKPGPYNIQVVSEKLRPVYQDESLANSVHTQLRSLILKPVTE